MNYKRVIISFGTIFGIVFIVSMLPSNLIQNEDNLEGLDKFSRHILENHKKDCESGQQSETDSSFCKAEYDMMLKNLQEF